MILKNKEGLKMEEEVKVKTKTGKKNKKKIEDLGIKIFAICAVIMMVFGVSFTTIYMLMINNA